MMNRGFQTLTKIIEMCSKLDRKKHGVTYFITCFNDHVEFARHEWIGLNVIANKTIRPDDFSDPNFDKSIKDAYLEIALDIRKLMKKAEVA